MCLLVSRIYIFTNNMYIKHLSLVNIGPFKEADLSFPFNKKEGKRPITIITGKNGTGKSIVIDAIRAILMGPYGINRDIISDKNEFSIKMEVETNNSNIVFNSTGLYKDSLFFTNHQYADFFVSGLNSSKKVSWIIDYWNSNLGTGDYTITSLSSIDVSNALVGALNGQTSNVELIKFICSIDYLRSSEDSNEREVGNYVYNLLKTIINKCLVNGEFKNVLRKSLSPIVTVNGQDLTLEKLSSGNLLLIERFVDLIRRMYGICELNNWSIDKIGTIPGVLLIDEIENHLHPQWQKSVLSIIQDTFPELQIILTTHSPFVVSSIKNATIYVCKSLGDHSVIEDESSDYSNLPVDEVLNTPVFDVGPFSNEITKLLQQRKDAIREGQKEKALSLTQKLLEINSEYFTFYKQGNDIVFFDNEAH